MRYRIELEIETNDFIPNADMSDIPDLNEHLKAIVGDFGDVKSFHVRRLHTKDIEPVLSYDAKYIHGAN